MSAPTTASRAWGEAYGPAETTKCVVDTLLAPLVTGQDPTAIDVLWHAMYQRVQDYDPRGFAVAAISAVDIALWDIAGKAQDRPVHELLGGAHRQEVQPYATGIYFTAAEGDLVGPAVEEALRYREQGFRGVKMKIALRPRDELRRVEAVREALGEDIELMVDANHGYAYSDVLRRARSRPGVRPDGPDLVRGTRLAARSRCLP